MYMGESADDFDHDEDGLGLLLPAATGLIGGLFARDKDPGRLATNLEAYNAAINGNPPFQAQPSALEFLRIMSTSWATTKAKQDALAKYNQALQVIQSSGAYGSASAPGTTPKPTILGGILGAGATAPQFGGPVIAGMSTGPLLVAGAAALAIVMLSKRGKR
jgi:hypothetical protein